MNNPKCPYCGAEMFHDHSEFGKFGHCYICNCGASSPSCTTKEDARAAAMQRWQKPLKPMTLEQVRDRGGCPVWCEDRNGSGAWALVDNGEDKCFDADYGDWEFYCYGWTNERGWRAWEGKPTDEERKAEVWKDD